MISTKIMGLFDLLKKYVTWEIDTLSHETTTDEEGLRQIETRLCHRHPYGRISLPVGRQGLTNVDFRSSCLPNRSQIVNR